MPFEGSYLWRLRQKVGSDPVLMPGAMLFLVGDDDAVLFTRRTDNGMWCLPAGGAEEGSSFGGTAITELCEETSEMRWADPAYPPSPLEPPAAHAVDLYRTYLRAGEFQIS
ncbi:MAG TPA: NUDIX domain-containing protein [Solirubrobacterales bacterium]|nr:NUDIX domain-containing protein [Solirubrobacterales bacterium]